MTDRPILFSAAMVRALLDGKKTQTRRILKPTYAGYHLDKRGDGWLWVAEGGTGTIPAKIKFAIGDRLYVREHWKATAAFEDLKPAEMPVRAVRLQYLADGFIEQWDVPQDFFHAGRHRQAMHMPRWASRLTLVVTDVRVERLQDISGDDAMYEGVFENWEIVDIIGTPTGPHEVNGYRYRVEGIDDDEPGFENPEDAYKNLWEHINGRGSWDEDPWVVAYTFEVVKKNIDLIDEVPA